MKFRYCLALTLLLFPVLFSCQSADQAPSQTKQTTKQEKENKSTEHYPVNQKQITGDWMTWYNYTYYQVRLASNFIGYSQDSVLITKKAFLNKLATGRFIALKIASFECVPIYKLSPLAEEKGEIRTTVVQMAESALALLQMEGKPLPAFHFTDMEGKTYDKKSTKGKIVIVKCWFIHCAACVKEFPVLNNLVEKYKQRQDVEFVSLASDSKQDLVAFLAQKKFRYAVVPDAKAYMSKDLGITEYPTHLLVDKNGVIKKVTNAIDDLIPSLEKELR